MLEARDTVKEETDQQERRVNESEGGNTDGDSGSQVKNEMMALQQKPREVDGGLLQIKLRRRRARPIFNRREKEGKKGPKSQPSPPVELVPVHVSSSCNQLSRPRISSRPQGSWCDRVRRGSDFRKELKMRVMKFPLPEFVLSPWRKDEVFSIKVSLRP